MILNHKYIGYCDDRRDVSDNNKDDKEGSINDDDNKYVKLFNTVVYYASYA